MGKRYGPRNLVPLQGMAVGRTGGREVQRVTINGRRYVEAYVKCGKPNCSRCVPFAVNYDRDRPGHGPYWFLHVTNPKGHTIRKYVGRDLQRYLEEVRTGKRRAADAPREASEASEANAREPMKAERLAELATAPEASILREARLAFAVEREPTSERSASDAREEVGE